MRTRLFVGLLIIAAHPSLRAQTAPADMSPPPATPAAVAEDNQAGAPAVAKGKDTLSVDFPDEEIRNVLRNVADLFELNLVIPEALQGKTSIKLRDVTWRQIFQVVLNPVGYTFVEDNNIIKVVTIESLNLEPVTTEVFVLNYAKASEVRPSIESLIDSKLGGKIVTDARSNALVVTERPSAIQRIRPIIESLDRPTEQVMIESKFIEVNNTDVKDLGVNWSTLAGYQVSTQPTNTYVRGGKQTPANDEAPIPKLLSQIQDASTTFSAVFSAPEFATVLSALTTGGDNKLVSNPTVVTLNNAEANINIGKEFPIPNYTYNQERGSFEVSGFTYKPIGINLKVTPQINNQGFIKLNLEPEISEQNGVVSFGAAGGASAEIPIIDVKKTKTQITLKDGFTLGIGGLVATSKSKNVSKVPVLSNIPGLGRLFKHESTDTKDQNLLIFITARILKPDGASVGEVFDPRVVRKMKLTQDELPGFRDGSDPFAQPPAPPEKGKK